jgi:hypothetical protein
MIYDLVNAWNLNINNKHIFAFFIKELAEEIYRIGISVALASYLVVSIT